MPSGLPIGRNADQGSGFRKIQVLQDSTVLSIEEGSTIDQIDHALARHYGFTDEELDFIINYDIKYRMGRDSGDSED